VTDLAPSPAVSGADSASAQSALTLSVVLPCLNEAETLETCVRKAQGAIVRLGLSAEVIVADNGSTDGSQELARRLGARVVDIAVRGYGAALQGGIEAARGELVIMADADDSYDLAGLEPFITKLREGYDLVMGNRFAGGIAPGAMPPLHRYLGNPVLTTIGRLFFRSPIRDFHCGMRGFRRDSILGLGLRTTGMEFASEMVAKSALRGLRVTEVPTPLARDGRSRPPHLRSWRDGWRHLRFLLLYSPRYLFLLPGILLILVGLVGGIALMIGPVTIGGVRFDVNTMLYCSAAIILGAQLVLFWTFAEIFATGEGLLPPDPKLFAAFNYVTLELGLAISAGMFVAGLIGGAAAVADWGSRGFGDLEASRTLRLVIPSVTLMILGAQGIMSSFFLSVLGLRRR
jgi:glycosyltransferase involved in cell wall biosynthesis